MKHLVDMLSRHLGSRRAEIAVYLFLPTLTLTVIAIERLVFWWFA